LGKGSISFSQIEINELQLEVAFKVAAFLTGKAELLCEKQAGA